MKKIIALLLAAAMVFSLAACGSSKDNTTTANGESKESSGASSISVCIASEPQTIDPALNSAVDGATMLADLFSGLAKWSQKEDGTLEIVPDMAEELVEPVDNGDGTFTYTYTLRDAKWSDGEPVTSADFAFAWNRAASVALAGDYNYMFEVVDGYAEMWEDGASADAKLNVEAVDAKTLKVTTEGNLPYWNELLAFPVYFPVREDIVDNDGKWATDPSTYVSNGMYTLSGWEHNSVITLTKSENHPDADTVTMDEIKFYLSDDANNMLANFKNGEWLLIDDVPTNEIATLKTEYPTEFYVEGQIGTYYVCWNINEDLSPAGKTLTADEQEEVRNAVSLLFDRNYIVNDIAQGGQVPAASFVAMGITEPDGSQFYEASNDGKGGYYSVAEADIESNFNTAIETLKKYYTYDEASGKFTDFPQMTYLYNTSEGHKAIGEYLQSALANVGINIQLTNQEWNTFLETRKAGDYTIARNGWIADYNDGICFLDMWTTGSGNNDVQFGKGDNAEVKAYSMDLSGIKGYESVKVENGTWAETYDVLIKDIKAEQDLEVRNQLMHKAEDLLMSTGCITPLYFYTDLYMLSDSVSGFFSNPLGYKYFMHTTIAE